MHSDYKIALLLTIIAIGAGIILMALPPVFESLYSPQPIPFWIWRWCLYSGIIIIVIFSLMTISIIFCPAKIDPLLNLVGLGGRGGNSKVVGKNSGAEGGAGGDAEVIGDNSYARGGDGGNSGTFDGRGGRRTMSQGERLNLPTNLWPYGYGGAGANAPEYDRRLTILTQIRTEYLNAFSSDAVFINAGIDQVPIRWVNKRLEETGETWRVEMENGGYKMPPLG